MEDINMEYTLSIIKPDATAKGVGMEINEQLEQAGLKVHKQLGLKLSKEQAEQFYAEHKERPFFASLIEFMTSGDVIVQILSGPNAIAKNREVMGATDPKKAESGTIRHKHAASIERNCVHGSDSPEAAAREIAFFFPDWSKPQSACKTRSACC